ncbi:MAG: hypothetical protein ABEK16_00735 [Candidatus Nanohalobium sp.]
MKGQYLAVETVFTFGLGLMLAVGVITLFNQYKAGLLSEVEPEQAEMVQSEVLVALNALREVDESGKVGEGRYSVDLPQTLAGSSYNLRLGSELVVGVNGRTYSMDVKGFRGYRLKGAARGGDVTIFKRGKNITLRAD